MGEGAGGGGGGGSAGEVLIFRCNFFVEFFFSCSTFSATLWSCSMDQSIGTILAVAAELATHHALGPSLHVQGRCREAHAGAQGERIRGARGESLRCGNRKPQLTRASLSLSRPLLSLSLSLFSPRQQRQKLPLSPYIGPHPRGVCPRGGLPRPNLPDLVLGGRRSIKGEELLAQRQAVPRDARRAVEEARLGGRRVRQ